jgi:uncharacterized protein YhaN
LSLDGFGRFAAPTKIAFDVEGLTVVYGDNERGKTTIKDAVCATIFGFSTIDEKNKYRPWDSSTYTAAVTFSSKGNHYCIKRDFETDHVVVRDVSTEKVLFQGVANPRGRGTDYEVYIDFVCEQIGFKSPDIFRLTTLIEQMHTKTTISKKIRQLISGSERVDCAAVVNLLEAELEEITKDIPWKSLRKKREIEKIDEKIYELSTAIADAQETVETFCRLQTQIDPLEKEIETLKNELDTKKENLKALETYIHVEKGLSTTRKNVELLQQQSETLDTIRKKVHTMGGSNMFTSIPWISFVVGVILSIVLWVLFENLLLTITAVICGIIISATAYGFKLQTSALTTHLDEGRQADIEKEQTRLKQQTFELDSLQKGILAKYPVFVNADVKTLLSMQEDLHQQQHILEEKIEQKKDELEQAYVNMKIIEQKAVDFHSWEEEKKILDEKRSYLKLRKKALITAISVLNECIKEYQFKYIKELEKYISGAFKKITDQHYASVTLEKDTLEPVVSTGTKSNIKKESLSTGALEQLYFAMRLSMAYLLSGEVALPFLLDDAFVSYDDNRLENIKYILSRVKKKNQVILFVHDSFYKEWADTVIDLNTL